MKKKSESKKTVNDLLGAIDIIPLKYHEIHWNDIHIIIEEGVSVPIPQMFLQNMVTEGVIEKLPSKG